MNPPSTRFIASCFEAIKKVLMFDTLMKKEQEIISDSLNKLPIDDEAVKVFVRDKWPSEYKKIMIETSKIMEAKNKKDKELQERQNQDFYNKVGVLKIDNYQDNVEIFYKKQPFFYDKYNNFWFWDNGMAMWERVDEIQIMTMIDKQLNFFGQTVTGFVKASYLEAFKRVGRLHIPKEPPKHWVQFKSLLFDYKTNNFFESSPEWFVCNPIQWYPSGASETPVLDKLFADWVGEDKVIDLYEILAYCCIADYPIHLLFCLVGEGRNGKSSFIQLLTRFIGVSNSCSTELDSLIDSRFETAKLYKKLICTMGETNFGVIQKTSLIKRLTGQDMIGYEFKNKMPFDAFNYAKIIISSNRLPVSEDTSDGWYRRWHIIDFPNIFPEGKNIIELIPDSEFEALAKKVTIILPKLMELGRLTNQGTIEERKQKYMDNSNPLPYFIKTFCYEDFGGFVKYEQLYMAYLKFLEVSKKRGISRKGFSILLDHEGLERKKTTKIENGEYEKTYFIEGLRICSDWLDRLNVISKLKTEKSAMKITPDTCDTPCFHTLSPYRETSKNLGVSGVSSVTPIKPEFGVYTGCENVTPVSDGKLSGNLPPLLGKKSKLEAQNGANIQKGIFEGEGGFYSPFILQYRDYETFIEEYDNNSNCYPKSLFLAKYGQIITDELLKSGRVVEMPAGHLKVVK